MDVNRIYKIGDISVLKGHDQGWDFFVDPLIEACYANNVKIHQIKEKWGELRFYTGPNDHPWLVELIKAAERISSFVCEKTGQPGSLRNVNGWVKTLSDEAYFAETHKD